MGYFRKNLADPFTITKYVKDEYTQVYENKYMYQWKEGEILFGTCKPDIIIGEEAAREMIAFRKEFFPEPHLALLYVDITLGAFTPEARKVFSGPESMENIIKGAIVVKSSINALLANFILSLIKIKVKTRLFTKKEDAVRWLLQPD